MLDLLDRPTLREKIFKIGEEIEALNTRSDNQALAQGIWVGLYISLGAETYELDHYQVSYVIPSAIEDTRRILGNADLLNGAIEKELAGLDSFIKAPKNGTAPTLNP